MKRSNPTINSTLGDALHARLGLDASNARVTVFDPATTTPTRPTPLHPREDGMVEDEATGKVINKAPFDRIYKEEVLNFRQELLLMNPDYHFLTLVAGIMGVPAETLIDEGYMGRISRMEREIGEYLRQQRARVLQEASTRSKTIAEIEKRIVELNALDESMRTVRAYIGNVVARWQPFVDYEGYSPLDDRSLPAFAATHMMDLYELAIKFGTATDLVARTLGHIIAEETHGYVDLSDVKHPYKAWRDAFMAWLRDTRFARINANLTLLIGSHLMLRDVVYAQDHYMPSEKDPDSRARYPKLVDRLVATRTYLTNTFNIEWPLQANRRYAIASSPLHNTADGTDALMSWNEWFMAMNDAVADPSIVPQLLPRLINDNVPLQPTGDRILAMDNGTWKLRLTGDAANMNKKWWSDMLGTFAREYRSDPPDVTEIAKAGGKMVSIVISPNRDSMTFTLDGITYQGSVIFTQKSGTSIDTTTESNWRLYPGVAIATWFWTYWLMQPVSVAQLFQTLIATLPDKSYNSTTLRDTILNISKVTNYRQRRAAIDLIATYNEGMNIEALVTPGPVLRAFVTQVYNTLNVSTQNALPIMRTEANEMAVTDLISISTKLGGLQFDSVFPTLTQNVKFTEWCYNPVITLDANRLPWPGAANSISAASSNIGTVEAPKSVAWPVNVGSWRWNEDLVTLPDFEGAMYKLTRQGKHPLMKMWQSVSLTLQNSRYFYPWHYLVAYTYYYEPEMQKLVRQQLDESIKAKRAGEDELNIMATGDYDKITHNIMDILHKMYVPTRQWELQTLMTGQLIMQAFVVAALARVYAAVTQHLPQWRDVPCNLLTGNVQAADTLGSEVPSSLATDVAFLVGTYVNDQRLMFPLQYIKDKQYSRSPVQLAAAIAPLRRYSVQKRGPTNWKVTVAPAMTTPSPFKL